MDIARILMNSYRVSYFLPFEHFCKYLPLFVYQKYVLTFNIPKCIFFMGNLVEQSYKEWHWTTAICQMTFPILTPQQIPSPHFLHFNIQLHISFTLFCYFFTLKSPPVGSWGSDIKLNKLAKRSLNFATTVPKS